MDELKKTAIFCLVAGVLAAAAVVVDPGSATPEIFSDQGEAFFPDFTDPQAPRVIEVVDYDEATATARPLKVEFKDGKWIIPSHHNYPADAEDRLGKTSAALIELRKDMIISDRQADHAEYGVTDPLDQDAASLAGRGKRVSLRGENDEVLAEFVIGKDVEGKPGHRYMRIPGQRRVYAVKTSADVSAEFEDWIETDLLKLSARDIRSVRINRYSVDEIRGQVGNVERMTLTKNGDVWRINGPGKPNSERVGDLTGALDELRIVDVQPKPAAFTRDLKTREGITLTREAMLSLRRRGFFVTRSGQLLSNEGEIIVETANGLQYTMRFGEIAGGGPAPTNQEDGAADQSVDGAGDGDKQGERRYLFITVSYSEARAKKYADGDEIGNKGEELARELSNRFAEWYYVISGADFNKLRPRRRDLRG